MWSQYEGLIGMFYTQVGPDWLANSEYWLDPYHHSVQSSYKVIIITITYRQLCLDKLK